ncbi:MAG: hypothetical protein ABEL76_13375 [Bradymonadaceae bacterium]
MSVPVWGIGLCVWLWVGGATAAADRTEADPPEYIRAERPVRVAVAPTSFRLFGALSDRQFDYELADRFRRAAVRHLANHGEDWEVVSPSDIRRRLRSEPLFSDSLKVAEEWARLGIQNYKRLRLDDAIDQLEKAVQQYRELRYARVNPHRVADVLMYLSLSYLSEDRNAARAVTLMQRMIRLAPQRILKKGFYPDEIVNFYRNTRKRYIEGLRTDGVRPGRAREIAETTDARVVLFADVLPADGAGYRATLRIYDATEDRFLSPESVDLPAVDASRVESAATRLISRVEPCLRPPASDEQVDTVVESRGSSPFSVQLTFAYASFLKYPEPIERPFGNLGMGLGAHLLLTEEFGLGVGVQVLKSLRDYSGLLVDDFSTIRGFAGADLGWSIWRFNLGLRTGLEGARIGTFQVCTDVGDVPLGCPDQRERLTFDNYKFLLGVNARPRVRFRIVRGFQVVLAGSLSYYFFPFAGRKLRYPLTGEVGIQYRF